MKLIEYAGWLWFLATLMIITGAMTKALIALVWSEGLNAKHVSSDDALKALFQELGSFISLLRQRWMATLCAAAVFFLTSRTQVSFFASLGFFAMTFVIAGMLTPTIMLQVQAKAQLQKLIKAFRRS
ncbi:MAG: hypothetical protein Q7S87_00960 [Agitococcus sp.]|nr:hypothetical protein [Agitococcus sp.]